MSKRAVAMVGAWGAALVAVVGLALTMQPVKVPAGEPQMARKPIAAPVAVKAQPARVITLETVSIVGTRERAHVVAPEAPPVVSRWHMRPYDAMPRVNGG